MTPKNIISCFHTTGVHPPEKEAIKLPGENPPNLAEKAGIAYIPLYTTTKRLVPCATKNNLSFTEKEDDDFEMRYEEGDLHNLKNQQ